MALGRFYHHTAVYTIGNLIYRGAAFALIPLYTQSLTPAEYGTLELIVLTATIVQSICAGGVAHSALRFYYEDESEDRRRSLISTVLIGSFGVTAVVALAFIALASPVSRLIFGTPEYAFAFQLVAVLMVLEISREINLSYIRAKERSGLFVSVAFLQLVTHVGVTVLAITVMKLGIIGVLVGNLSATAVVWLLLTVMTLRECGLHFEWRRLLPLARYGAPLTLSELAASTFQSLDRWALNSYAALSAIGMYALGMRVGSIIPILLTTPFTKSYGPYRFSVMKQADAKQIYARVNTYYLFVSCFVVVAIGSACREILQLFADPEYWGAATVIPLLLIPAGLSGVDYCFQTGIYIVKATKYLLYATVLRSVVTAILVFLLVPPFGIYGAAFATMLAGVYTVAQTWWISQRVYPVQWEYGRMARIVAAGAIVELTALNVQLEGLWPTLAVKGAIVATYPIVVGLMGVYSAEEIAAVKGLWARVREPRPVPAPDSVG